jgi:hypothetical protein
MVTASPKKNAPSEINMKSEMPTEDDGDGTAIVNVVTGSGSTPEPVIVSDESIFLEPTQPNDGDLD